MKKWHSGLAVGALLAGLLLFFALFRPILTPFVIAGLVAYVLNPLVTLLTRHLAGSLPHQRGWVAFAVLSVFCLLAMALIATLTPLAINQISGLLSALPGYLDLIEAKLLPWLTHVQERVFGHKAFDIPSLSHDFGPTLITTLGWLREFLLQLLGSGGAFLNLMSIMFVMPVLAFYFLKDWSRLTAGIDSLLPPAYAPFIRQLASEINVTLAGFARGMFGVCLVLGAIYATGLTLIGLPFGLAIGLVAGLLSFIPYVGSLFGVITSLIVAAISYDVVWPMLGVIAVFGVGQALEGNYLTPKWVGERIGLHPVWVIFALMAGASLMGFVGLMIAVPFAACIGVMLRHSLSWYRQAVALPNPDR